MMRLLKTIWFYLRTKRHQRAYAAMMARDIASLPVVNWLDEKDIGGLTFDDDESQKESEPGDFCARWVNGHLAQECAWAGTEYCDWGCPHSGVRKDAK